MGDNQTLYLYFDGASRGNPGRSGAGVYIKINHREIAKIKKFLGIFTNNQAEYQALLLGLSYLLNHSIFGSHLVINGDSQLIIRQLQSKYRLKSENLRVYYNKVQTLLSTLSNKFTSISFKYIPREKNKIADKLANQAIDEK